MKKTLIVLLMVLLCAMLIISCNDDASSSSPKATYLVSFQLGEGKAATGKDADFDAQDVVEGEKAKKPDSNPIANSKFETFKCWSADNGATEFDFDKTITKDIVLKAIYKEYEAGDIVTYGTYPDNYAIESLKTKAITWKILSVDKNNSRMLVISENILEKGKHFDEDSSAYSDSDIRAYLKGNFISTYGLSDVSICNVDVTSNIEVTTISTTGEDKVFLLSNTEAKNSSYFADNAARVAYYDDISWCWTLRTAQGSGNVYCVGNNIGSTGGFIGYNSDNNGLRPAFWINL